MLDGRGQRPTSATVQKTWAKVVRDKASAGHLSPIRRRRRKAAEDTAPVPLSAPERATPMPAATQPLAAGGTDDDPPTEEFQLKLAGGPKRWTNKGTKDV